MRVEIDGEALRKLRRMRGTSGAELARAVGLTPAGLCHVEQGRRRTVSSWVFDALVVALDIADRPDWVAVAVAAIPTPRSSPEPGITSACASGTTSSTVTDRTGGNTSQSAA